MSNCNVDLQSVITGLSKLKKRALKSQTKMENNITILETETFFHSENPFPIINFHSTTKLVHHFPTFSLFVYP